MRKLFLAAIAALAIVGCASTEMRQYVGAPIETAFIDMGRPENVFDMPDGRRAFQFRWGGGAGVLPGTAYSTANNYAGYTSITTTYTPAVAYASPGCLVTLIASDRGAGHYVIDEYRIPRQLVC